MTDLWLPVPIRIAAAVDIGLVLIAWRIWELVA